MNNMIVLPLVLPLLGALLLPILMRLSVGFAVWVGPMILAYGGWLLADQRFHGLTAPFSLAIGGFAPPLGINLYVDALALMFAFAAQLLGLLFWPFKLDQETGRRQSLMLLLVAASTGLALSGDLFNLYVFYELVAVATFGLIAVSATGAAYVATLRYLVLSGVGSVLTLLGIALIYGQTGTLNLAHLAQLAPGQLDNPLGLAAFLAILIGVGVKAELFPVNTWVPEVYATASSQLTAFLAGLVSKLALLMILRLLVLLFHQAEALQVLLVLGSLGVISGELAAWRAKDMRRMLAFSSIGQLGMIFIALAIPEGAGLLAVLALALHHLIIKSGLFMLAEGWGGAIERLRGAAGSSPLAAGLFVLFSLSLIGFPPLPGFWAKFTLITELAAHTSPLYLIALTVFLLGTVIEASYLFRLATLLYGKAPAGSAQSGAPRPAGLALINASLCGIGLLAATLFVAPLGNLLEQAAAQAGNIDLYVDSVISDHGGGAR